MFALIETKGATHIAIYVPGNTAAESLPALASMLENNAKFVKVGWREIDLVKPDMSIILGDKYVVKDSEGVELTIAANTEIINKADFVIATPEALLDSKKAIAKKEEENSRLRKELDCKKMELESLKEKIENLTSQED